MEFLIVHLSLVYKYFAPMEQVLLQNHDERNGLVRMGTSCHYTDIPSWPIKVQIP